jgi:hypothetical protein
MTEPPVHCFVRSTVAAALLAVAGGAPAQSAPPRQKPITRHWECDNGRTVTINYHPYRIREPAWLTYLGNRREVSRKRVNRGIAATTADGKVSWHETGDAATLEYAGLLDKPISCSLKPKPTNPKK